MGQNLILGFGGFRRYITLIFPKLYIPQLPQLLGRAGHLKFGRVAVCPELIPAGDGAQHGAVVAP